MLNESNVLLIRHAEKPVRGRGLAPMGEARAQAYATYFPRLPIHGLDAEPEAHYHYLFAAKDSHASHRPRLTLEPLRRDHYLIVLRSHLEHCINSAFLPGFDHDRRVGDGQTNVGNAEGIFAHGHVGDSELPMVVSNNLPSQGKELDERALQRRIA